MSPTLEVFSFLTKCSIKKEDSLCHRYKPAVNMLYLETGSHHLTPI